MLNLYVCGLFTFLKISFYMTIILGGLAAICGTIAMNYEENVLVDLDGRAIGKVYVDENNEDIEGNRYENYNSRY